MFRKFLCLCLGGLLASGCHLTLVKKVQLEAVLVNDDNTLLSIEGHTNLPDQAVIETRLMDERGRRWSSGTGAVSDGRFVVVLDISHCPGFKPLQLDVYFDPLVANAAVQSLTGSRGEALGGPLVLDQHDRLLVLRRMSVMLQMTHREAALRKLESGDGDVSELESYLARHPNDAEALIGLGLAYLKQRPSERHPGSKAITFVSRGLALGPKSDKLELEAKLWLSRLEAEERRLAMERERVSQPKPSEAFVSETLVSPGEALGAFRLGMRLKYLVRHFSVDHLPSDQTTGTEVFHISEFPGLELKVDRQEGLLVSASSTNPLFRTQEGLRVGSLIDEVRQWLPDAAITYGPDQVGEDGRLRAEGKLELDGLVLTVERTVNPDFPLPAEAISKIEVIPSTPTQ